MRLVLASDSLHLCHICMEHPAGSREHVPARSVGNCGGLVLVDPSPSGEGYRVKPLQDGFWRKSLCARCNSDRCNANVAAYKALVDGVERGRDSGGWTTVTAVLEPRRVIRQIITMFLASTQREPPLTWSPLRAFVVDDSGEYAIRTRHFFPPHIYLFKNAATNGRIMSFCEKWRLEPLRPIFVGAEFSFPPLGVVLCFAGEDVAQFGMVDITDWARWTTGCRAHVTLTMPVLHVNGDMPLLFGTDDEVRHQRNNHAVGAFAPHGTTGLGALGAIVRRGDDRDAAKPSGDVVVLRTDDPKVAGWLGLQEGALRR